jgi:hypothetical protein
MYALNELKRLLNTKEKILGAVISANNGFYKIATPSGLVVCRSLDTLSIGDRVMIQNGQARKQPAATLKVPV